METTIQKWGNSLAVRIPREAARSAGLAAGTSVDLGVKDGAVVITPRQPPKYRLDDLLKGIRKQNLHGEIATGTATGVEAW